MKTRRPIQLLCVIAFFILKVNGQSSLIPKYEVGIHAGGFIYQGDLTPNDFGAFNTMKPGFGISATRNINSLYAVRLQFMRGSLKADEAKYDLPAWRQQRNFNFRTPVTELSMHVLRNITGIIPNEAGIINFSPYVFAGLNYSFLKIKRDWSWFNYSYFAGESGVVNGLTEDINHKIPRGIFSIPVGFGVRYGITEKLSFSLEGTYRILDTDYLDGFSQAANPDENDHYHTITVGLIYSFGKRNRFDCPKVRD